MKTSPAPPQSAKATADREIAARAARLTALMAEHSLAEALAIALSEHGKRDEQGEPMYVGWREAGFSRRVWGRLVKDGEFPVFHIGRAHMALREDVVAWAERNRVHLHPKGQPSPVQTGDDLSAHLAEMERDGLISGVGK